ncbi:MAG: RNA methyltransferase [Bacteroidota bacterium]
MITQSLIKHIRSLRMKKFRDEHRQYIAEGPKIIGELLECKHPVVFLLARKEWIENNQAILVTCNAEIIGVNEKELSKISCLSAPNQVLAVLNIPDSIELSFDNYKGITLVLDQISGPGNLGTIIRTADWFGIKNIICSGNCVELYNPKVIQATMGSFLRVNIFYSDLEKILLKIQGKVNVYGTYTDGIELHKTKKEKNSFIIIGNESKGISSGLEKYINSKIAIPVRSKGDALHAESLNASVAAALICYEFTK